MKNCEVVEKILQYHPNIPNYDGCDGYKAGDPEAECTGIVSALVPTVEVIRKTADLGCNLIITHEPSYYMTPDFPEWRGPFPNDVYECKRQLLEQTGITVWRDHDHIHMHQPDGIFTGVLKYLDWEPYYQGKPDHLPMYYLCQLPETTVGELREHLIKKLNLNGLRYIGEPDAKVSRVAICAHLYPGGFALPETVPEGAYLDYATALIREMEKEGGLDVLIPGEIIEWDVLSYIRDAVALGKNKACMNIGHFNMEELGMRYAADWITELVEEQVPVHYIPTGDIFRFV